MLIQSKLTRRILSWLPSGSFRRHVAVLSGASMVAQAVQLAAAPILTRLYSPAVFGDWTFIMAIVGIGTAFGGGRYELGIMAAKNDKVACSVACVQLICNIVTCLVATILILVAGYLAVSVFGGDHLSPWFLAVPFIMFWTTLATNARFWFLRHKEFRSLAKYRIMLAVTTAGLPIAAYPLCVGEVSGLLVGSIVGPCSILIVIAGSVRQAMRNQSVARITRHDLWDAFVCYRRFPLFTVPYGLVNEGRERGVVLTLALFAGRNVVGFYGQALRIMYVPIGLVGTSINSVLIQRASSAEDRQALERLVSRLLIILCLFAIPGFLLVAWFGEELFGFVFGAQWREAGVYATVLALPGFSMLLAASTDKMLDIIDRQHIAFLIELAYSLTALGGIIYGCVFRGNAYLGIAVFAGATFVGHVAKVCAVYYCWGFSQRSLFRMGGIAILLAGGFSLFYACAERFSGHSRLLAITIASGGVLCYYLTVTVAWYLCSARDRRALAV